MTILSIYSPSPLNNISAYNLTAVTQFVGNPFATRGNPASTVWIQCTPAWMVGYGLSGGDISVAGIGILEIEYIASDGSIQQTSFGDVNDPEFNTSLDALAAMPTRYAQTQFLSATILLLGLSVAAYGTVTFFQWE